MLKLIYIAIFAACLGSQSFAQDHHAGHEGQGTRHKLHEHMQKGMQDMQSMQMTGDTDVDFAQMMAMHHEHGIQMAKEQLKSGDDPKMKSMAQKMIKEQEKEKKELQAWLA
ncbi:MAG TPA: DUF305 domain-containing protein, partial [Bdellovibrionales bacterium]|nr:DUF305 domain-containing protein [Bdellovibrionales bacterium]